MKRFFRFLALFPITFFVLLFLYPLLHELGHAFSALLLGVPVTGFTIFPIPSVECGVDFMESISASVICLSGLFFPLLVCIPLKKMRGFAGYIILLLLLLVIISGIIELLIAIEYNQGYITENDDIVFFLQYSGLSAKWAYAYCSLMIIGGLFTVRLLHPYKLLIGLIGIVPSEG